MSLRSFWNRGHPLNRIDPKWPFFFHKNGHFKKSFKKFPPLNETKFSEKNCANNWSKKWINKYTLRKFKEFFKVGFNNYFGQFIKAKKINLRSHEVLEIEKCPACFGEDLCPEFVIKTKNKIKITHLQLGFHKV